MKLKAKLPILVFLAAILIGAAYLIVRLTHLTIIPIFTDEAIYLRWAQIALSDPRWRFISLIDGKQPLLIWLFLPALKLIQDPLVAGRVVSITAGFIAMTSFAAMGWYFYKFKGAVIAALTYLLIPIFVVYDRLAVYEALFGMLTVLMLFLSYLFGKKMRLDVALIFGMVVGAGLLTKSYALFYLLLLPLTLLAVDWNKKHYKFQLFKWVLLVLVVAIEAKVIESILYLSEFRHTVAEKNLQFIYSFQEFFGSPLKSVWGNLTGMTGWLIGYVTWPGLILILVSLWWVLRKNSRLFLFFFGYFLIPYVALAFFGKVIYPRFLLFMLLPLLYIVVIFLANQWERIKTHKILLLTLIAAVMPMLVFDYKLLFDPIHAPLPTADRQQFINDWPAGYGIKEVVSFLEDETKKGKVIVGTEGTFGLYPMALELYMKDNAHITFKAMWPVNEFPKVLLEDAKSYPTYLVFKERNEFPKEWPMTLVEKYQRGDGPTYLHLFKVNAPQ